jgi:PD-(D/E)XK nuclease superfamily
LLAHSLVEHFFALENALAMSESEVQEWFDASFHPLIETEGAVLLMHGRRSDYEGLRYRLKRTLARLLEYMKAAGAIKVQSELALKGLYTGGKVMGYADLVLSNNLGQQAVIDMKWRGVKKYSLKLAENTHLQLAIYAELLRQKTGAWPDVGYYVLSEAKLFIPHENYFPVGNVVLKKTDESTPDLWARFKKSHAWRNQLLQQGRIEVALEGILELAEPIPPDDGLKPELLDPDYNDYLVLAGRRPT